MTSMNSESRDKLMDVSVATLATASYKRGLRNQTIQDLRPVSPKGRNMVARRSPCATSRHART